MTQTRWQSSSSLRSIPCRLSFCSRLLGATALGLTSIGATGPSCGSLPPCFDDTATYRVQLLERLPESDCDPSLELDWSFEVRPTTMGGEESETCTKASLALLTPLGTEKNGTYGTSNRLQQPVQPTGHLSRSIISEIENCDSPISLTSLISTEAESVADALPNEVIWRIHYSSLTTDCIDPVPQYASCTDYYTSITEKL